MIILTQVKLNLCWRCELELRVEDMDTLSNELLIESYKKAKKMQLNEDFIQLFEIELEKRGIIEHFKESS